MVNLLQSIDELEMLDRGRIIFAVQIKFAKNSNPMIERESNITPKDKK